MKKTLLKKKIDLLKSKEQYISENKIDFFKPYDWQLDYWKNTLTKKQLMLDAAVRVGKTDTTTAAAANWLSNYYPDNWNGFRFNYPIVLYALGNSFGQIKRVLQKKMLGEYDAEKKEFKGGWIKKRFISTNPKDIDWNGAVKGLVNSIKINTVSGLQSTYYQFSYNQGQLHLMGDDVDVAIIDEQPKDPTIAPQITNRLSLGMKGSGGILLISMTPELGDTPLLLRFKNDLQDHQYYRKVTWWDCKHWTPEAIKRELSSLPPYLRDLKSKGITVLGSGIIYPFLEEDIVERLERVPDHFKHLGAIDIGINTGAIGYFVVNPDNDKIYLKEAFRTDGWGTERIANKMLSFGKNTPWAWPHDGNQVKENDGVIITKVMHFRSLGLKMLKDPACVKYTEDGKVKKSFRVETGIAIAYDLYYKSLLKICPEVDPKFHQEMRLYYRDRGKIKAKLNEAGEKIGDHLLDMKRYGVISIEYASPLNYNLQRVIEPRYTSKRPSGSYNIGR